ncbi:winged helix-turn-helix transcriptional regulator [Olivibacter domesticus]|uniref:Transcriptional regulator, HxlR family n=1 Tax=Olivibacter domesticus TaxID=407022 RepID=A0A1H7W376_OLID1|nr:winged helix-turn-helix transcriptional regulator [Olivibacter domesticus]SEM16042.1 transcriptional regulator, HxlR family [Olivibacter domesticus]
MSTQTESMNVAEVKEEHKELRDHSTCMGMIQPVQDALYVLNGKWKLPIIISLSFGNKRFSEMAREIPKITDRMLSKELRELEMNQLVKRTVYDTVPVVVEYSLTDYGSSLDPAISELRKWGIQHRERITRK